MQLTMVILISRGAVTRLCPVSQSDLGSGSKANGETERAFKRRSALSRQFRRRSCGGIYMGTITWRSVYSSKPGDTRGGNGTSVTEVL